ncbi:hypothetical protein [Streptomyces anulatus]|uniref:hypothetical protein n=1 Tax=Streptomyces anulatus TaxID=1892 RepID=UPI003439EDF6
MHATELQTAVNRFIVDPDAIYLDQLDDEKVQEIEAAATRLQVAWTDVALAGPEEVVHCAAEICGHTIRLVIALQKAKGYGRDGRAVNQERESTIRASVADSALKLWESVDDFAIMARLALDDDGSVV